MRKIAYRVLRASPVVYSAMIACATVVRADNCSDPSDCQAVPGNVDWTTGFAISGIFMLICWRLLGPRLKKRPGPPPAVNLPDRAHTAHSREANASLAAHQPEHGYRGEWEQRFYNATPQGPPGYQPYPPAPAPSDHPLDQSLVVRQITEPPGDLPHEGIAVRDLSTGNEGGTGAQQTFAPGDLLADQAGYQGASGAEFSDRQARPVDAPSAPGDRGHDAFGARQEEAEHDIARTVRHPEAVQQPASPHAIPQETSTPTSGTTGRPGDVWHTPTGAPSETGQQGPVPGADRQHGFSGATNSFDHSPHDTTGAARPLEAEHDLSETGGSPERQHTGAPETAGQPPPHPSLASGPPGIPVASDEAADPHYPVRKPDEKGTP